MYQTAYELVTKLFANKVDKANRPYIIHLLGVSKQGLNEYEKTLGLLHDLFEETNIKDEELIQLGFPLDMIRQLKLLTKSKSITYQEYIQTILESNDLIVLHIKKYDILNNLDPERRKYLSDDQKKKFSQKYESVLVQITEKIHILEQQNANEKSHLS